MEQQVNAKFIHIGKCGGSYIKNTLKIPEYHFWPTRIKQPKYKKNEHYIIWIRDPIKRYISAFNYARSIINTKKSKKQLHTINKKTSPCPKREIKKIKTGVAYNKKYDNLILYFKSANHLAEALSSDNKIERNKALRLMNNSTEHIFKGIGWYLQNGDFIKKKHKEILFVGSVEHMVKDCKAVCKLLHKSYHNNIPIRSNNNNTHKYLSPIAIRNIKHFFNNTDYKAIKELYNYGFIDKHLLNSYDIYIEKVDDKHKDIIKQVKILKNNSDYAFGDILYRQGNRWEYRIQKVLTDTKYRNTILFNYLKVNNTTNCNYTNLLNCIKEYNFKNKLPLPCNNEIVLHLRMGDTVTLDWYLKKNYVSAIENILKNNTIHKITIVTCFSYGAWTKDSLHLRKGAPIWDYTVEKQQKNEETFSALLSKIQNQFNIPIHIYSNEDIDRDFCYCVFSKFYINDRGGFDVLTEKLNQLYLKENTIDHKVI
jgi:hypothetical protein